MQPPPLPVKYWRRFKYRYNALLLKMDPETASMLGFTWFKTPDDAFGPKMHLQMWSHCYAQFFGDASKEALHRLYEGWNLMSVKHCKDVSRSPWHEFLLLEWRHIESQAFICLRLERDAGDKVDANRKGPPELLLAKQHSHTSVPRSMEKLSGGTPEEPSGPLKAVDTALFRRSTEAAAAPDSYTVLASFAPAKNAQLRLTLSDALMAASACNKVSRNLYDFRYMCYWFARMIYESLLHRAGHAALENNELPPVEVLDKRCNSIRGCAIINNMWSPRVNKLDLKWRARKYVPPPFDAIAEGHSALIPESEQTNFFKQVFSKKAAAPKLHNALQRVLDAECEVRAEFEIEVAQAKDLYDTDATFERMRAETAQDKATIAGNEETIAGNEQTIASMDAKSAQDKETIASLQAQLAQAKLQAGTS